MRVLRWYLRKLENSPISTNVASAFTLMTLGDVMAQEIEMHYFGVVGGCKKENLPVAGSTESSALPSAKLNFRRYGTLSPNISQLRAEAREKHHEIDRSAIDPDTAHALVGIVMYWYNRAEKTRIALSTELRSLDIFRAFSMAFWTGFVSTPINLSLYALFDRYLPSGSTFKAVAPRVGLSFLAGIPQTVMFFGYGCILHHTTEWLGLIFEWTHEMAAMGVERPSIYEMIVEIPYDFSVVSAAMRLKLQNELIPVTITGGSVWIPTNIVNFALLPPQFRPVLVLVCSAFWNCYMSIAQHRPAEVV